MLACECGSRAVRITDSWEQTDETWTEHYECQSCRSTGTLEHRHGTDHLSGCLTHSRGVF